MKKMFVLYLVLVLVFGIMNIVVAEMEPVSVVDSYLENGEHVAVWVASRYHGFEADGDTREYEIYEYIIGTEDHALTDTVIAYATIDGDIYQEPVRAWLDTDKFDINDTPETMAQKVMDLCRESKDYDLLAIGWTTK